MPGLSFPLTALSIVLSVGAAAAQDGVGGRVAPRPSLPGYRGVVERFTLAPGGEVDGLLLVDGTEVETPPHLSAQVTAAVRPGDSVTVRGLKAASLPVIQAVTIEDDQTGRAVADNGLSAGSDLAGARPGTFMRREGRVRQWLHGAQGEVNGLLLTDGTTIRFPLMVASAMSSAYRPGRAVVVEGEGRSSPYGTVVRAETIAPWAPDGPQHASP